MSIQQLNNLNLKAGLEADGDVGSAGQVLSSTGPNGIEWINQSTLSSGSAERTEILVKNLEGSALSKGDPVYIIGSVGASERLEVGLANAGDAAKMPCVGLLTQDLAINGEGTAIVTGKLKNLITSPIDGATPTENDTIYVKSGGGLTLTKPTGATNLIQNVGQVGRVSTSSDGNIVVSAILRSNDVPNLPTGRIWVGDGNTTVSGVVYLDEANGRMGIGTSSPRVPLQVSSNEIDTDFLIECGNTQSRMSINNTSTGDSQINFQLSNSSKFAIGVDNSDSDKFKISGSSVLGSNDRFVIDSLGNVGIGTTSPQYQLDVIGGWNNGIRISGQDTVDNFMDIKILNYVTQAQAASFIDCNHIYTTNPIGATVWPFTEYGALVIEGRNNSNGGIALRTGEGAGQATRIAIRESGNVGIGTTSPTQKLHVDGNARVTGAYYDSSNAPGTSGQILSSTATGTNWISGSAIPGVPDGSGTTNYLARWTGADTLGIGATYDNGTNVGIGTTNPGEKLSIQPGADVSAEIGEAHIGLVGFSGYAGFSHIDRNSAGNYALLQASNGATYLNTSAGQPIRFRINNTDKMILTSGGSFGVGTTSPGEKLTVKGTDQYIAVEQTNYPWGGTNTLGLKMGTNGVSGLLDWRRWTGSGTDHGTAVIAQVNSDGGYGLDFRVDNQSTNTPATTSRMFLSSSGEVGIGTTSPNEKLEVAGNTRMSGGLDVGYANNGTNFIQVGNQRTTDGFAYIDLVGDSTYSDYGLRIIRNSTGANASSELIHRGTGIFNFNATQAASMTFRTSAAERLRIDPSGNVGIGTTSPAYKLDVNGTIASSVSSGVPELRLSDAVSDFVISTNTGGEGIIKTVADKNIRFFRNNSTETMRIAAVTGNVGIATTSPSTKLHVFGTTSSMPALGAAPSAAHLGASAYGTLFSTLPTGRGVIQQGRVDAIAAAYDLLLQPVGGNVAIGLTSATQKLHVGGAILANGAVYSGSTTHGFTSFFGNTDIQTSSGGSVLVRNVNTYRPIQASAFTIGSDYRLKSNITPLENAIDRLNQLNVHRFNWNDRLDEPKVDGFIAHEVSPIIPEAVLGEKDEVYEDGTPKHQGIDQAKIVPLLTAALQEAILKIEQLETRIQTLENN